MALARGPKVVTRQAKADGGKRIVVLSESVSVTEGTRAVMEAAEMCGET